MALPNKFLPDFVYKKVDILTASKMFKESIDKICKHFGMDPDWETNRMIYKDYIDTGDDKCIVVNFEAGPHDWGVGYSLGSNPKSFNPMGNIQDWYLECYYGFDVVFTPTTYDGAKSFTKEDLKI